MPNNLAIVFSRVRLINPIQYEVQHFWFNGTKLNTHSTVLFKSITFHKIGILEVDLQHATPTSQLPIAKYVERNERFSTPAFGTEFMDLEEFFYDNN